MRFHLPQVADIADVISRAVLVHVLKDHFLAGDFFRHRKCLKNRATVRAPAPEVIYLSGSGICDKRGNEARDVMRVDVVANLLSFVSIDVVFCSGYVALY